MEEVTANQKCKFCNKSFGSGRSLGGHMRWWHVNSIEKRNAPIKGFETSEHSGYRLRVNPKKSSMFTALISNNSKIVQSDRLAVFVPKKKRSRYSDLSCSKSEPSSFVAMYLLMLSRGAPIKGFEAGEPSGYGLRENPKKSSRFMASNKRGYSEMVQTDRLTAFVPKRKRSRTTRYSDLSRLNSNASLSIDQELEEEVAMSLLMLSRGVPNWAGISSISDTSSITDYRVGNLGNQIENPNSSDCGNGKGISDEFGGEEQKRVGLERKGISDEFGGNEQKRVGLEDYVDGFSGIDSSGTEMEKTTHDDVKMEPATVELGKGLTGSETFKFNPRKDARFDPKLKVIPCIKINVSKVFGDLHMECKYKCRACSRIFQSHPALGGHRSCCHNLEVGGSRHEIRKSKVHQCPVCFKAFASGQALGGHMGAHSVANTGVKENCNPNLEEEDFNAYVGFNKCWMRSDRDYKPLLGLLSS